MREIVVGTNEAGQRLDKLIRKYLRAADNGFLYKMLRKKNIVLNDRKAAGSETLREGDIVRMYFSEDTFAVMTGESAAGGGQKAHPSAGHGEGGDRHHGGRAEDRHSGCKEERRRNADEAVIPAGTIIYEDDSLLVISKPAGWLSQSDGSGAVSVNERCLAYLRAKGELSDAQLRTFRPGIANRLDRNTTGLLLFGKTLPALQALGRMLKDRSLAKYYLTVVSGHLRPEELAGGTIKEDGDAAHGTEGGMMGGSGREESGAGSAAGSGWCTVRGYLRKDPRTNRVEIRKDPFPEAAEIHTAFRILGYGAQQSCTALLVHLVTGKTHQIRAHLSACGHPVLGDPKYGDMRANRFFREQYGVRSQLLHAYRLHFPEHCRDVFPALAGKELTAPPTAVMQKLLLAAGISLEQLSTDGIITGGASPESTSTGKKSLC